MIRRAQPWLGTLVEVTLATDVNPQAFATAFAEVGLIHRLMSFHDRDSDVSRFNRAPVGTPVEVDARTWEVLALADQIAVASEGCFDVACAPALVDWDYLPAPSADAPRFVPKQRAYELGAKGLVCKTAASWIDLGGIAKGYAVDAAITALQRLGVSHACVNAGGDLRVIGEAFWHVTVRHPLRPRVPGASVSLRNEALATSGIYFTATQLAQHGDVSPLVDGRSGRPVTEPRSASVLAPSCTLADALTKVVTASGDVQHPSLSTFGATAFVI